MDQKTERTKAQKEKDRRTNGQIDRKDKSTERKDKSTEGKKMDKRTKRDRAKAQKKKNG